MRSWSGKRVLILGAARQGQALARYLVNHGAEVILTDSRPDLELEGARVDLSDISVKWVTGGHPIELLDGIDLMCVSGGVPLTIPMVLEAQRRAIALSNDSQIFLEAAPCKVIGITGSAGKTTTTTLVGRIAEAAYSASDQTHVWVGGNIGTPLIASVDEMRPTDLAIMELSSFQLELMTRSPQISAILNITPNHLDRHGTMAAYREAKAHILDYQTAQDIAVLGREDQIGYQLSSRVHGRLLSFGFTEMEKEMEGTFMRRDSLYLRAEGSEQMIMGREAISLRGDHNLSNVLAACAIAASADLSLEAMRAGTTDFHGVAHRLEWVRLWEGANWYNDSIATAPERTMAAILSFQEPLVLLVGGRDKKLPWDKFAEMAHQRVDHLVLFGEMVEKVAQALDIRIEDGQSLVHSPQRPYTVQFCNNLHEAVRAAAQVIEPGDVVLLSPGGTSFDEFKDFEERGERFREWVNELLSQ